MVTFAAWPRSKLSVAAGRHSPSYLGRDSSGHLLPAGSYPILIVASNSQGSATAQVTLTISGP